MLMAWMTPLQLAAWRPLRTTAACSFEMLR